MNCETIIGACASAQVFTTECHPIEDYAAAQIKMICDHEAASGSVIRIMPDVHPGKVGPIGLTMIVGEKVLPSLIGVDIGCGVLMAKISRFRPDYQKLDTVIRERVPSGFATRKTVHALSGTFDFDRLFCTRHINRESATHSLGTLGGGNHFIEIDKGSDGGVYLVIHTGSRHLGVEAANHYLREGQRVLKERGESVPYEMTYLDGVLREQYLGDVSTIQDFAALNREIILREIVRTMKWDVEEMITSAHNYIAEENGVLMLRKGAISAKIGERLVIPANMRDGVIVGIGKGNPDWNCSAPHGTGRIMNREQTRSKHTVSEFKKTMAGIYSTCIGKETLDEAPFAYRPLDEVAEAISDTVEITEVLKPLYCFKNGGGK